MMMTVKPPGEREARGANAADARKERMQAFLSQEIQPPETRMGAPPERARELLLRRCSRNLLFDGGGPTGTSAKNKLDDADPAERRRAAASLGESCCIYSYEPLVRALQYESRRRPPDGSVQAAILEALVRIGEEEGIDRVDTMVDYGRAPLKEFIMANLADAKLAGMALRAHRWTGTVERIGEGLSEIRKAAEAGGHTETARAAAPRHDGVALALRMPETLNEARMIRLGQYARARRRLEAGANGERLAAEGRLGSAAEQERQSAAARLGELRYSGSLGPLLIALERECEPSQGERAVQLAMADAIVGIGEDNEDASIDPDTHQMFWRFLRGHLEDAELEGKILDAVMSIYSRKRSILVMEDIEKTAAASTHTRDVATLLSKMMAEPFRRHGAQPPETKVHPGLGRALELLVTDPKISKARHDMIHWYYGLEEHARAIYRLEDEARAERLLAERRLDSAAAEERWDAATSLGVLRYAESHRAVLLALQRECGPGKDDREVKAAMVRALERIGVDQGGLCGGGREPLKRFIMAHLEDTGLAETALHALSRIGNRAEIEDDAHEMSVAARAAGYADVAHIAGAIYLYWVTL